MGYARGLRLAALTAAVVTVLGGCGAPVSEDKSRGSPAAGGAEKTIEAGQDSPAAAETAAGLAQLDEADRALAAKQRICPVSGALLGSMGKPVKISVKGQTVFLCCAGCEAEIRRSPDEYLQKLPAAAAK